MGAERGVDFNQIIGTGPDGRVVRRDLEAMAAVGANVLRTYVPPPRWLLDLAFLLPMGISSVVLAFGYLVTFNGEPFPLRASWLSVPLIQSLMATPLVVRLVFPALQSISPEQREAAATAGANQSQTWWYIELGIIRHVVVTAIGYAAIASIGEYGAASLLAFGNQATLPTELFQLISRPGQTNFGMAMAITAILIVVTYCVVALVAVRRRRPVLPVVAR